MRSFSMSGEELANFLSHALGLLGAIAATPILIVAAAGRGDAADVVGSSIFAATMILLYLASTLYHAAPVSRLRDRLRTLDHSAIYLLIAGTYTPFTLGVLAGPWGWTLFGLVWGFATLGIVFKMAGGMRYPRLSTALYVAMGWLMLIAVRPLVQNIEPAGLLWLVAGGVAYSGGIVFYTARRLPYHHLLWHLCVLAGSICHFFAVLGYAS